MQTVVCLSSLDPTRKVDLPDGWHRVRHGAVEPGDRYARADKLQHGVVEWEDAKPLAYVGPSFYDEAAGYALLIRKDDRSAGG